MLSQQVKCKINFNAITTEPFYKVMCGWVYPCPVYSLTHQPSVSKNLKYLFGWCVSKYTGHYYQNSSSKNETPCRLANSKPSKLSQLVEHTRRMVVVRVHVRCADMPHPNGQAAPPFAPRKRSMAGGRTAQQQG